MIFKRKSKMKHPIYRLLIPVLLFVIRTSSEQQTGHKPGILILNKHYNSSNLPRQLDPSDLMPGGVDLEKLVFIDNHQNELNLNNQSFKNQASNNQISNIQVSNNQASKNQSSNNQSSSNQSPSNQTSNNQDDDEQFMNLVSSNDKTALPLRSPNDKSDHFKIQVYNQPPTIEFENVFENDLTKREQINSNDLLNEQTYSNYFSESDPNGLTNNFKRVLPNLKLDKDSREQLNQQLNQQLKQHLSQQISEHIDQQEKAVQVSASAISQLDSKISLNEMLDQLNILMGSNLGYMRRRQRRIIRNNPGVLAALDQGIKLSLSECKYQFKDHYWNCPSNKKVKGREMFGKILNRGRKADQSCFF